MNIIRFLKILSVIVLLYFIVFGVVIFSFNKSISQEYKDMHEINRFYNDETGPDKAIIIDTPKDSTLTKINIIENARESIDLSYYSMENGQSANFFYGLLLDAGDRGVQVRVLLDGVKNKENIIIYALNNHPNIEVKFYEPVNLLIPWTINNRLHDKYIIVDNNITIIGGRNIGDRFCVPEDYNGDITYDRDVLIYKSDKNDDSSVVNQLSEYFKKVFDSEYTVNAVRKSTKRKKELGNTAAIKLRNAVKIAKTQYGKHFEGEVNWDDFTYETNKITLIHNPITRFNKEPWVWYEITNLMKSAKNNIFIQSPYIAPSKKLINNNANKDVDVTILTNSSASTPNIPAFSSYLNHRSRILSNGCAVYEYHGENSIHAKSYSIDDNLSLIGSFNMDTRSASLSLETMVVINSEDVKNQLDKITNRYVSQSLLVDENGDYININEDIPQRNTGKIKKLLLSLVGILGRGLEFLL